jgi:hypothetical protein
MIGTAGEAIAEILLLFLNTCPAKEKLLQLNPEKF